MTDAQATGAADPTQQVAVFASGEDAPTSLLGVKAGKLTSKDAARDAAVGGTTLPRSGPVALSATHFRMPEIGETFLNFELIAELGRGASGRVFLGRQVDMAGRLVVIKVTTGRASEVLALARLRHTNVVPIYSAHDGPGFLALCMPYYGRVTLAAVLSRLREGARLPAAGAFFVGLLNDESAGGGAVADAALSRFNYVDAVLWLGARLADGLAHAHDRGLVHCDLKPANVLLADDGQPVLLDFDVAVDVRATASMSEVGGTLQYMSPDQFDVVLGLRETIDGRSDVYSLGLLLYELLTGRLAFEPPAGTAKADLRRARDARLAVPRVRPFNPAVSPAAEAIVRTCLAADPVQRYPSAAALAEDIGRHLAHLPLLHTRESSLREKARKWARRNPKLASPAMGVALATVAALCVGLVLVRDGERARLADIDRARSAAGDVYRVGLPDFVIAQARLIDAFGDSAAVGLAVVEARRALARYGLPDNPAWRSAPAVAYLPAIDRDRLEAEVGSVLFLLVAAGRDQAEVSSEGYHALAEEALAGGASVALARQRSALDLARRGAGGVPDPPSQAPLDLLPLDRFLVAADLAAGGRERDALPLVTAFTADHPDAFGGWLLRGNCHAALGQEGAAIACYSACIALRADVPEVYYRRARAYFLAREYVPARADFDLAIRLAPSHIDARVWRAMTCQQMGHPSDGVADLDAVLSGPTPPVKAYFIRSRLLRQIGAEERAFADEVEGLRHVPTDEASWIERGLVRMRLNPERGLEDFREAERLNPRSFPALQNQAHVLTDALGRPAEAIVVLGRVLTLRPDFTPSLVARALLLARQGRAAEALKDVDRALSLDSRPAIIYDAAAVLAVLARAEPAHGKQAIRLFASALRAGHRVENLDSDRDFDAIRGWDEFNAVRAAARELDLTGAR